MCAQEMTDVDRFALEEALMACENIADDLRVLIVDIMDGEAGDDPDKIVNILQGVAELHKIRCRQTYEIFEQLIRNGNIR